MKKILKNILKPLFSFYRDGSSKRFVRRELKKRELVFLEVGAGAKKGTGNWLTLDQARGSDIYWDLRKGIPFPDESVNRLYSCHFFEHLTYREGQVFLKECMRVLKSGGEFSICVPNARLYIDAYINNADLNEETMCGYKLAYPGTTKIDYVNYIAYMAQQHKYMFDKDNLVVILKDAGLKNVSERGFDPELDPEDRDITSIYARGEK